MSSKKLRAAQGAGSDELKVDMSPMIDMVFLLLIFFLVNATLIIVKMDKKVKVPIALHAERQESKLGRIVINVYDDKETASAETPGRFKMEDGRTRFENDEAMEKYIKERADEIKLSGVKPRIHLRGDEGVQFTYVRRVIRNAAAAGVNEVIFISLPFRQD